MRSQIRCVRARGRGSRRPDGLLAGDRGNLDWIVRAWVRFNEYFYRWLVVVVAAILAPIFFCVKDDSSGGGGLSNHHDDGRLPFNNRDIYIYIYR